MDFFTKVGKAFRFYKAMDYEIDRSVPMQIKVNKNVIVYEEEKEIVLINMLSNNFYALDNIGALIWKKVNEFETLEKTCEYLSGYFDIGAEELRSDILEFLSELKKAEVIDLYE